MRGCVRHVHGLIRETCLSTLRMRRVSCRGSSGVNDYYRRCRFRLCALMSHSVLLYCAAFAVARGRCRYPGVEGRRLPWCDQHVRSFDEISLTLVQLAYSSSSRPRRQHHRLRWSWSCLCSCSCQALDRARRALVQVARQGLSSGARRASFRR
jgi:hypothetical protein